MNLIRLINPPQETNAKSEGRINFGLFWGTRRLNHGFGERVYEMDVMEVSLLLSEMCSNLEKLGKHYSAAILV